MNAVQPMNRALRRLQRKAQRGKPAPRRQELPGAITSLAQMVTFAVAIEASGIVKGLSEQFAAARSALKAVRERVTSATPPTWGTSTAMRAEELQAVSEAIRLHRFQLEQLSAGELQRLHRIVVRAESDGGHVL